MQLICEGAQDAARIPPTDERIDGENCAVTSTRILSPGPPGVAAPTQRRRTRRQRIAIRPPSRLVIGIFGPAITDNVSVALYQDRCLAVPHSWSRYGGSRLVTSMPRLSISPPNPRFTYFQY